MTLEMEAVMKAPAEKGSIDKMREAIREATAAGILTDAQVVRYARQAMSRAREYLGGGDRTEAWRDAQLAADLLRAANPVSATGRQVD